MRIKSIEIKKFGKLSGRNVRLGDGLNVLYAPNETGKSTLAGLIKYLLYGFDRTRSSKANPLATKTRFAPWEGGEPNGSLSFEKDGKEITVNRSGGRNALIYDSATGSPVYSQQEPGESLYGVSLSTFESTAFFGQSALSGMDMGEMEERLKNIVTGADEDASYDVAYQKLKNARNRLDNGRQGGLLPNLRREISDLSYRIETARGNEQAVTDMGQECLALERALAEREAAEEQAEARRAEMEERERAAMREKREAAQREFDESQSRLNEARAQIAGMTRETLTAASQNFQRLCALREVAQPVSAPKRIRSPKWPLLMALLMWVLTALAAAVTYFGYMQPVFIGYIAAGITFAGGLGFLIGFLAEKKKTKEKNVSAYTEYQAQTAVAEEMKKLTAALTAVLGSDTDFQTALRIKEAAFEKEREELAVLDKLTYRLSEMVNEPAFSAEYRALKEQNDAYQKETQALRLRYTGQKTLWEERKKQTADTDAMGSELTRLRERETEAGKRLKALELAMQVLEEAHLKMSDIYAPLLAEKADAYFAELTDSRLREFKVGTDGVVRILDQGQPRALEYYSVGTADAAYIALRLALVDMLYQKEKPLLVFDDSFANFDEERTRAMFRLLSRLGDHMQILYFTCRDPEPLLADLRHHHVTIE